MRNSLAVFSKSKGRIFDRVSTLLSRIVKTFCDDHEVNQEGWGVEGSMILTILNSEKHSVQQNWHTCSYVLGMLMNL